MTAVALPSLVLLDPDNPRAARPYAGLHAVSPILLGFVTPFLLLLLIAPRAFMNLGTIAFAILALVMLTSTVIFLHGIYNRGQVAAITFDPLRGAIDIVETGLFARTVTSLPFIDVAEYRTTIHYDREGTAFPKSQIVLRTGESIILPIVPTPGQLATIRALLGLFR